MAALTPEQRRLAPNGRVGTRNNARGVGRRVVRIGGVVETGFKIQENVRAHAAVERARPGRYAAVVRPTAIPSPPSRVNRRLSPMSGPSPRAASSSAPALPPRSSAFLRARPALSFAAPRTPRSRLPTPPGPTPMSVSSGRAGCGVDGQRAVVHCTGAGVDSCGSLAELDRSILLNRTPESFGPAIAGGWRRVCSRSSNRRSTRAGAQREHRWAPRDIALVAGTSRWWSLMWTSAAVASRLAALGIDGGRRLAHGARRRLFQVSERVTLVGALLGLVAGRSGSCSRFPTHAGHAWPLLARGDGALPRRAVLINAGRGSK